VTTKELLTTAEPDVEELPRRLCSEIQLFDLCELERCSFKDGRYCTHADLLARFEALAEPEDRPAQPIEDDDDDDDELYPEEREEDDDEYSVFDDEDGPEKEWE
jgi:hypothetical protein